MLLPDARRWRAGPPSSPARTAATRVWFGAAAPLGLLAAGLRRAGRDHPGGGADPRPRGRLGGAARRPRRCCAGSAAASTWSPTSASTPAAGWTGRSAELTTSCERLAPGVDTDAFHPGVDGAEVRAPVRPGRPAGGRLRVPAGAAQGPGHADPGAAADPPPGARRRAAASSAAGRTGPRWSGSPASRASPTTWSSPARCRGPSCPPTTRPATCSRCRAGPARRGLDVEGPRHRLPGGVGDRAAGGGRRLRRRAGRGPRRGRPGTWWTAGTWPRSPTGWPPLLADPALARRMGAAGRAWVERRVALGHPGRRGWRAAGRLIGLAARLSAPRSEQTAGDAAPAGAGSAEVPALAASQPIARSRSAWRAVSTPSAVTVRSSAVRQRHQRRQDPLVGPAGRVADGRAQPVHERPGDLQLRHRQRAQVGEVGVAGAEVVDGDPDARGRPAPAGRAPARPAALIIALSVISSCSRCGGQAGAGRSSARDLVDQPRAVHLPDGQVDADERGSARRRPSHRRACAARLGEHPAAQRARSGRSPRPGR